MESDRASINSRISATYSCCNVTGYADLESKLLKFHAEIENTKAFRQSQRSIEAEASIRIEPFPRNGGVAELWERSTRKH